MKRVKTCTQLPMWSEWLQVAIYVATMNQEARLSEGDTMPCLLVYHALGYIEAVAKHESQHSILLESKVISALDYGHGGSSRSDAGALRCASCCSLACVVTGP